MQGKIALEEHLTTPENNAFWDSKGEADRNGKAFMADVERRLTDTKIRLEEMEKYGIGATILSLTSPGVQSVLDKQKAIDLAKSTNDVIVEKFISADPKKLYAFAAVAMQDPKAAADEAERAIKQLGMKGVLINGYTNVGDKDHGSYLDEEPYWEFWERMAKLDAPVYLHPREPLPGQQTIYKGYPELIGSAWGFAHETATHAIRLMLSGLFDKYPNLQVILGHLGEGLSQLLPRVESRLYMQREGVRGGKNKHQVTYYYSNNFYVTTSGHFHTKALIDSMSEVGVDRMMFSVDYPYEYNSNGAPWFDSAPIAENDRRKIGYENAKRLFKLP